LSRYHWVTHNGVSRFLKYIILSPVFIAFPPKIPWYFLLVFFTHLIKVL
jgi:hypothetical protein